ncbi:hypothetical protein P3X46_011361 [Hevea brasiliensis]|uniref:Essential protein Yae1 N-terminal domain-containing protein n=1 Tax=Hevea brasiliensis TaxID=3981 RepID=A0ABQ9MKU0_HEVBR|nr:uncharacterized protein LOC110666579 isoform X2 [Hevea brasiliensis]XP_021682810.1 uncharacterized protein LOC110666579 isoform X2 [Hevea brasiliensis]XP_058005190.1 uncharacterized protein LOC110666579 isoform X2 [Hevea brasiliensis]KAJ9179589.1 hypothetical protein P3X46_011361 [Hevea brasiliensis]KAJ9179590.1 hypothetical protein P3X46_011361 [Hevea brasiliensis]
MESSFAKELYSESLHLSKVELGSSQTANCDLQDEDGSFWAGSHEELDKAPDLDREWERRRDQFHTIGYRDGLIAGKEAIVQDGFNIGFKESVLEGYNWGIVRGITSALACLPEGFKESLIETQEKINNFQTLYESVHSLSTTDALKLFHDTMAKKAVEQSEHPNATSEMASLRNDGSDCSLENYVGKLQSLLLKSPAIESHLSVN